MSDMMNMDYLLGDSSKCPKVSVIIVNYNTKKLLENCINSIIRETIDISYEIIVSDNGSADGSIQMVKELYPKVILIENNENIGFGAANNRGLERAKGKYIFYLNSDTIVKNNAIKLFYDTWERIERKINPGCMGAFLKDENGNDAVSYMSYTKSIDQIEKSFARVCVRNCLGNIGIKNLPDLRIGRSHSIIKNIEYENLYECDGFVSGAAMFLKNDDGARFDERFFLYCEESDLQLNSFSKKGKKILILDSPEIIHYAGKSDRSGDYQPWDFRKKSNQFLWLSQLLYAKKNIIFDVHDFIRLCIRMSRVFKSPRYRESCSWVADEISKLMQMGIQI